MKGKDNYIQKHSAEGFLQKMLFCSVKFCIIHRVPLMRQSFLVKLQTTSLNSLQKVTYLVLPLNFPKFSGLPLERTLALAASYFVLYVN